MKPSKSQNSAECVGSAFSMRPFVGCYTRKTIRIHVIALLLILAPMNTLAVATESVAHLPYCDVGYRVTKNGSVRDVKIIACSPEELYPKYRSKAKRLIGKLSYQAKSIDGQATESNGMSARVIFEEKYYKGVNSIHVLSDEIGVEGVGGDAKED